MVIPPVPPPVFPPAFINIEEFPKRMHKISSTFYSIDVPEENENEVNHSEVELEEHDDEELRREATVEGKTCSICCASDSDTIIMNCRHSGVCYMCARALWENFKKCHICRENIEYIMQFKGETEKTVEIVRAMKLSP